MPLNKVFLQPGEDDLNVVNFIVENHDMQFKSICVGEKIIKELINASVCGVPLSFDYHIALHRIWLQRIIKVAYQLPDFINLPSKLQQSLLKENINMVFTLRGATDNMTKNTSNTFKRNLGPDDCEFAKKAIADVLKLQTKEKLDNNAQYIDKFPKQSSAKQLARYTFMDKEAEERQAFLLQDLPAERRRVRGRLGVHGP